MIGREVMDVMIFDPQRRIGDRSASVSLSLYRLAQAIKTINQEESERFGLSPIQIQALLFIRHTRSDTSTVGQFAQAIGASHVTAVKILNGIEEKGLVRKTRNPSDRRITMLALTDEGQAVADRLEIWGGRLQEAVSSLGEPALGQLDKQLGRLVANLRLQGLLTVSEPCEGCVHFSPNEAQGEFPHYCHLIRKYLTYEAALHECPEHESLR